MKADSAGTNHEEQCSDDVVEERETISRILAGEKHRYGTLVDRYQRRLYWSCLRMLDDPDEAEDVVQETFVRAYEKLTSYEPQYRFYTWVYSIARNRCLNLLRRRKAWGFVSLSSSSQEPHSGKGLQLASAHDTSEGVHDGDLGRALHDCRQALPDDQREVFDLRHDDEFSYAEIAQVLSVPQGTVMSRLSRAREKMRDCLQAKGMEP